MADEIENGSPVPEMETPTLLEKTREILITGKFSDVTFHVGAQSEEVKGHRLILAMSSPVFEEMLDSNHDIIEIPNLEAGPFKQLLEYIYTDNLAMIDSSSSAYQLYSAAKEYNFNKLMLKCIEYLGNRLDEENAIEVYEFSKTNGEQTLMDKAMEYCCNQATKILKHDSFLKASIDTITELFGQQVMNVESEMDLVEALKRVMFKKKLTKDEIRAPIRNIRILLLSTEIIASSGPLQNILTQIDLLSLLMNKITPIPSIPLTEDLNKSTTPRDQLTIA